MKKWQILSICLVVNSCDLDNDQHQKVPQNKELQEIDQILYIIFATMEVFRAIATDLNYSFIGNDKEEPLRFFTDCSQIRPKEKEIRAILERSLRSDRVDQAIGKNFSNFSEETKGILEKNIVEYYGLENVADTEELLFQTVESFFSKTTDLFKNLKNFLGEYSSEVSNQAKLKNSVEAFDRLCNYEIKYFEDYQNWKKEDTTIDKLSFIASFLWCFFPQFYLVFYENIFRVKSNVYGVYQKDLALVDAIR